MSPKRWVDKRRLQNAANALAYWFREFVAPENWSHVCDYAGVRDKRCHKRYVRRSAVAGRGCQGKFDTEDRNVQRVGKRKNRSQYNGGVKIINPTSIIDRVCHLVTAQGTIIRI